MDDIFVFGEDSKTIIGLERSDMTALTIPEGVVKVDHDVLKDCKDLQTIELPNSLESYGSFNGCVKLQSISVGPENKKFFTEGGVLYNKEKTILIRVPRNILNHIFEIPNGVTTIRIWAFQGCNTLSNVIIPASVTKIDHLAFIDSSLQTITIPDNVKEIGDGIFQNCKLLRTVNLPKDIKRIEESMFYDCSSLTELVIPDAVEEIGQYAFWGTSIRRIRIPKGVSVIDNDCFSHCDDLEAIDVDKDNPNYSSEKGILMNKERSRILCYPYNKDVSHLVIPDGVLEIELSRFSRNYAKLGKLRILEIPQSVESIPDNYFKDCVNLQSVIISEGVTHIGEHSFANCRKLREVTIPGSVKTIGKGAFENCRSLNKITIAQGVISIGDEAFKNCISLEDVSIADSASEIGNEAFYGCKSLSTVVLPEGLKRIAVRLFYNCESLREMTLPKGVIEICTQAFQNCKNLCDVTIPDRVTIISSWAFYGCSSLKSVVIPKGVTEIGYFTYSNCISLESIIIPQGVTKVKDAFPDCTSLVNIYIPDSVANIDSSTFDGCISLQSITVSGNNPCYSSVDGILYSKDMKRLIKVPEGLKSEEIIVPEGVIELEPGSFRDMERVFHIKLPDSLTIIGNCAFSGCRSIREIHLPGSLSKLGNRYGRNIFDDCFSLNKILVDESNDNYTSINGVLFDKAITKLIKMPANSEVEHYSIPDSIVEICGNAFEGCHSLKSIELTDNVIKIGSGAFHDCISLQSIEIPNSIIELGSSAFENCSALQEIEIPNSIVSIDISTFKGCSSLYSIDIPNSVRRIELSAFEGCSSLQSVDVPNRISSIGWNAFRGCASLRSFKIPCNLITLAMNVFNGCTSLRKINIPQSITKIEDFAFHNAGLEEVRLSSSIEEIGKHAFCNNPIKQYIVEKENKSYFANDGVLYQRVSARWINGNEIKSYNLVKYPEKKQDRSYIVDDKTIWIGPCAFKHAENLEEIALNDEINSIGEQAFASCKSLKKMFYPKEVSYVPRKAFENCLSLDEVYLTSVKEIYSEAFSDCTILKSIHLCCDDADLMIVSSDAFNNVDIETCVLFVPSGSRWSYRHHPVFGKFKNILIER